MLYIADLHIHSPYSRATSKQSTLAGLAAWAGVKGIQVVGTGDFTHPGWFRQLQEQLVEAEPGYFRLRDPEVPPVLEGIAPKAAECRFVLTAEISSIYKRHGAVRKIHNLLFVPDFRAAAKINAKLAGIGNIESDGRPILGLDSRDLLEILLEATDDGFLVPAHVWTPWFSLFGSKSGFDAIEECFDDLSHHIFALETGLSSDPEMNRLISALDRFALISNSDCHSPAKLGREANLFDTDFDFFALRRALQNPNNSGFAGTVEFFPEEGKYHLDGHRKCNVSLEPVETRKLGNRCPVCSKPLTVGVLHRVMELADREQPLYPEGAPKVHSLIPLAEVIGEILGRGPNTKGAMAEYARVIRLFGSEFDLYLNTPVAEVRERYSPLLAEAIERMRQGRVYRQGGYDGEFGVIRVFAPGERDELVGQYGLFGGQSKPKQPPQKKNPGLPNLFEKRAPYSSPIPVMAGPSSNAEQQAAIISPEPRIVVTAGPGTGKTHTLVARVARLVADEIARPAGCVVITFTNRAAAEVRERLRKALGDRVQEIFIGTFHAFCLLWLRQEDQDLRVAGREDRELLQRRLTRRDTTLKMRDLAEAAESYFFLRNTADEEPPRQPVQPYLDELERLHCLDIDGIIPALVERLAGDERFRRRVAESVSHLLVDEFQDLNRAQFDLVRILSEHAEVFAIGDPDQAIYGFRGSRPDYFFRFIEDFKASELTLNRNYRSAPDILRVAAAVVGANPGRRAGELAAQSGVPALIECYEAATPEAEAEYIVRTIEEQMGGISHFSINSGRGGGNRDGGARGRSFGDFAVLYRLSRQAETIAAALARRGIPYQLVGAEPFYMKKKLRRLYHSIRVAAGQGESADYLALVEMLPGIGRTSLEELEDWLSPEHADLFSLLDETGLTFRVKRKIKDLRKEVDEFSQACRTEGIASILGDHALRLEDDAAKDFVRLTNLAAAFGNDLAGFAAYLTRNAAATIYDDRAEGVALMTLHGAKGLEFPAVFITGLEEGILPHRRDGEGEPSGEQLAEERRLLFVGLTRARQELFLSHAATRTMFGRSGPQKISRFLADIPAGLVTIATSDLKPRKKQPTQMKLF